MDNKALEKYRAEHQTSTNHVPAEPSEFDPWDGHMSNTELAVIVLLGLMFVMALVQLFTRKKK